MHKDSILSAVFGLFLIVPCLLCQMFEASILTAYFVGFFSCMAVFFIVKHFSKE